MANLTDKLRREHAAITEALQTVNELGIGTKEGTAVLLGAKHLLLNHLAREDRELYPVLRRAAAVRPEVHRMLEHFATEMEAAVSYTHLDVYKRQVQNASTIIYTLEASYHACKDLPIQWPHLGCAPQRRSSEKCNYIKHIACLFSQTRWFVQSTHGCVKVNAAVFFSHEDTSISKTRFSSSLRIPFACASVLPCCCSVSRSVCGTA